MSNLWLNLSDLNIRWKKIPKAVDPAAVKKSDEAPTKLAIGVEGGFQVSCLSILGPTRVSFCMPPWRQPRGKWMVSLVNSHTNATSKR